MNEEQPSGTESKKIVSRSVAALAIICIGLVASLAVLSVVVYEKNNTIQTDNYQINFLNSQIYDDIVIMNLGHSEVVFNQNVTVQAGQHLDVYDLTAANYSGLIDVILQGPNLVSTWIRVAWGVNYNGAVMEYNETRNFNGSFFPYYGDNGDYYGDFDLFPVVRFGYCNVTLGNNGNQTIGDLMTITYHY